MVSFERGDDEVDQETQEMETGSPSPGAGIPRDERAQNGPFSYGSTMPMDDTLPLGEDEMDDLETQLLGEGPGLDGETQMLDDPECIAQPMEEYWDTEVVDDDDDDEGTERTVVLCDDDGLSDDAATPCGVGCDGDRGEMDDSSKVGTRTLPRMGEQGQWKLPVASEASTGEEGESGGLMRRRSFTEVRAASLRASGLAAACSTSPRTVDAEQNPFFCNHIREEKDTISVVEHNVGASEKDAGLTSNIEKFVDCRAGGVDLDFGIENSDKCMQNGRTEETAKRSGNLTVRKLTFEEALPGRDESTAKITDNVNSQTAHSLGSDYSVAGLSYVDSQEPGEQSQADAMDAIDKFLSVNDVGFSQEVNPRKTCGTKTPLVSSVKGALCLAKRGGHNSPVGKAGTFDWVGTVEDEGGGDFFTKRKDFFFGNSEHRKKSHSKLLKSRHCDSKLARDAHDNTRKNEGTDPKNDMKTVDFTFSDSRLKLDKSIFSKQWASRAKANRALCKEISGQLNEESTVQSEQATDVGRGEKSTYDVGPDTQMAAEAMEALFCGPFADHEPPYANSDTGNILGGPNTRATRKQAASLCIPFKRRGTSASDLGGGIRRSKRMKMLHAEAGLCSSNSSKESLKNSNMKRYLGKNVGTESQKDKTEDIPCTLKSINEHDLLDGNSPESFRTGKMQRKSGKSSTSLKLDYAGKQVFETCGKEVEVLKQVVETVSKEIDGCASLLPSKDVTSFNRKLVQRENNRNVTPVAHRTRKSLNTVEKRGTLSKDYEETTKDLMEVKTVPVKRKQKAIVAEATEKVLHEGRSSEKGEEFANNVSSEFDAQQITTPLEKPCRGDGLMGVSFGYKKGRTTRKSKFGNSHQAVNLEVPSPLRHVPPEAIAPCPTQQTSSTLVVEDAVASLKCEKNKSTADGVFLPSETDVVQSSVKGALEAPGVRTRSFIKYRPYTSEGDATQSLEGDSLRRATSSNATCSAIMNEKVPLQGMEPATSIGRQSMSDAQDAQVNARLKGTPKDCVKPPGAISMSPQNKLTTVSPVCTSVDPLRASHKKGSSKSLVPRALIRLESTEAAKFLESKDLRRRRDITSARVCLSHHLDDDIIKHQKKILARLGVSIVVSVSDATHFIADKFVRTKNMLEAMAVGKPVVTHLWLDSCGQASCFIDEKNYILRDVKKEKEIGFSMPASLACARQRPLLQGKRVFITPNVKPARELVADLVTAAQGQPLERLGRSAIKDDKLPDDFMVISCEEDFAICIPLLEKGAEIFSSELLLNGIVIQMLEYDRHRLFMDHVKRTRSTVWLRKGNSNQFLPVTKCM